MVELPNPDDSERSQPAFPIRTVPHPLVRLLLYLVASVISVLIGSVVGGIIAGIWLYIAHGDVTAELFQREVVVDVVSSTVGIYAVMIATTCGFVMLVDRRPMEQIGLRKQRMLNDLFLGLCIGSGYVALITLIYLAFGWIRFRSIPISIGAWALVTVILYPLIGIAEEIVFRGYLLTTFEEWKGRFFAIIVTSVLFWIMHLGMGNIHTLVGALTMIATGVMFALCRIRTGSLWLPIGLHASYDWLLLSLARTEPLDLPAFFQMEVKAPHWLVGPPGSAGVADLVLQLLMTGAIYVWLRRPTHYKPVALEHPADSI